MSYGKIYAELLLFKSFFLTSRTDQSTTPPKCCWAVTEGGGNETMSACSRLFVQKVISCQVASASPRPPSPEMTVDLQEFIQRLENEKVVLLEQSALESRQFSIPMSVDPKLFAHIHSDTMIKDTEMEGNRLAATSRFFFGFLTHLQSTGFKGSQRFGELMALLQTLQISADTIGQALADRVMALAVDKSLLVQGGWISGGSAAGHAMLYQFVKRRNGHYDLFIYNTGAGSGTYHALLNKGNKTLIKPVMKFQDVTPAELGISVQGSKAYSELFDQLIALCRTVEYGQKIGAKDIYSGLFGHIGHKAVSTNDDLALFMTAQRSGTCSWRVLLALARKVLGDLSFYKEMKFELHFRTLVSFFQCCRRLDSADSQEEANRYLLRHAATKQLRQMAKLYNPDRPDASVLSLETVRIAYATIKDLLIRLDSIETSLSEERLRARDLAHWDNISIGGRAVTIPDAVQNAKNLIADLPRRNVPITTGNPVATPELTPETLLRVIGAIQNRLVSLADQRDTMGQIYQIENFVRALPVPRPQDAADFWSRVPLSDVQRCFSALFGLLQNYGRLCNRSQGFLPFQQNTAYAILAGAHRLALRIAAGFEVPLHEYGICADQFKSGVKDPFFLCFSPEDLLRRQALTAYFSSLNTSKGDLYNFSLLGKVSDRDDRYPLDAEFLLEVVQRCPAPWQLLIAKSRLLQCQYPERKPATLNAAVILSDRTILRISPMTAYLDDLREMAFIGQLLTGYVSSYALALSDFQFGCDVVETYGSALDLRYYYSSGIHVDFFNERNPAHTFHAMKTPADTKRVISGAAFGHEPDRLVQESHLLNEYRPPSDNAVQCGPILECAHCEPALLPARVIYYFRNNLSELSSSNSQALFNLIFFKLLQDRNFAVTAPVFREVSNPHFVKQCQEFIEQGLNCFYQKQPGRRPNTHACLFFARLVQRLKQIDPKIDLPDLGAELNEWANNPDLPEEEKSAIHLHRMMQYVSKAPKALKDEERAEIVASWFYFSNNDLVPEWRDPYLVAEANRFIYERRRELQAMLEKPCGNNALHAVLKTCGIEDTSSNPIPWVCDDFPVYELRTGPTTFWRLNLLTAKICSQSGTVRGGSREDLTGYPEYQQLFGRKKFSTSQVGEVVQFIDDQGRSVRLWSTGFRDDPHCKIQCKIGGKWEQFISRSLLGFLSFRMPLPLRADHHHFVPIDGVNEIHIYSAKRNRLEAIVDSDNSLVVVQPGLPSVKIANSFFIANNMPELKAFEREDCILAHVGALALPRFQSLAGQPLRFNFDRSPAPYWVENPHFRLVGSQRGWLGHLSNYLFLVNESGAKRKLLVPLKPIEKATSMAPQAALDIQDSYRQKEYLRAGGADGAPQERVNTFLEYDIQNAEVKPLNIEGMLFLAYIYLAQKDYAKADRFLRKIARGDALSAKSEQILQWIIEQADLCPDHSPSACAIRLRAALVYRDWKKHPQEASVRFAEEIEERQAVAQGIEKAMTADCEVYADSANNVDEAFLFTSEEEMRLFGREIIVPVRPDAARPVFPDIDRKLSDYHPSIALTPMDDIPSVYSSDQNIRKLQEKSRRGFLNILAGDVQWTGGTGSLLEDCFMQVYAQAKNAQSDEEKVCVATRLQLIKNKTDYPGYRPISARDNHKQLRRLVHLALRYPKRAPELPHSTSSQDVKIQWLENAISNYETTREADRAAAPSLWSGSAPRAEPIRVHNSRPPQSLRELLPLPPAAAGVEALSLPPLDSASRSLLKLEDLAVKSFNAVQYMDRKDSVRAADFALEAGLSASERIYEASIRKEVQEFQADFDAGVKENRDGVRYVLKDVQALELLKKELTGLIPQQADKVDQFQRLILVLANKKSSKPELRLQEFLLEDGRFKPEMKLQQLVCLFLQGDKNGYRRNNPHLTKEDIRQIDQLIQFFLIESTELSQAKRALQLVEQLKEGSAWQERDLLENELGALLNAKMQYDPSQDRVALVLEYGANIRIRAKQVQRLAQMTEMDKSTGKYRDVVAQLIMGGGKTTVLAAILMQRAAQPGRLSMFIPPAAQFDTLRKNLTLSQHGYFLQEVLPIDLCRAQLTVDNLTWVEDQISQAREKGRVVLIKSETLQSFQLEYLSLLYEISHSDSGQIQGGALRRVELLKNILLIFKQSGDALCDEVDIILNAMREVNFPLGSATLLNPSYVDLMSAIFALHVSDTLMVDRERSVASIVRLRRNEQTFMSASQYREEVLPLIAKELFRTYRELMLPNGHEAGFIRFVLGRMKPAELTAADKAFLEFVRQLSQAPDFEKQEGANLIALAKHLFTEILPLTLTKSTNRQYGRGRAAASGKVVPYLGVDAPASTEFGNPWEAASYQFQTALSQGISPGQVQEIAQRMSKAAEHFVEKTQVVFDETPEAIEFRNLTGVSLADIGKPGKLRQATDAINGNVDKLLLCEGETICNLVGFYAEHLSSNPQNFVPQTDTFRAFSGTPWNAPCYPGKLAQNVMLDVGVEGRIADVMLQRLEEHEPTVHTIERATVRNVLGKVLVNNPRAARIRGIIDASGMLKDFDNCTVAREILEYYKENAPIQAVLFFGRKAPSDSSPNTLMVLRKGHQDPEIIGSTRPEELDKHSIDPKVTFTYFDECHCEATDIPQQKDAVNLISIDENVIRRTLFQGMLRLRGYFGQQDIEYVIHKDAKKLLLGETVLDFVRTSIKNQAMRKARETFRSYKQKIDHALRQVALEEILRAAGDPKQQAAVMRKYESVFVFRTQQSPYLQFGALEKQVSSLEALKQYSEQRSKQFSELTRDSTAIEAMIKRLNEVMKEASECPYLPKQVAQGRSDTLEMQQEVNLQTEIAREIVHEIELDRELQQELNRYQTCGSNSEYIEKDWSDKAINAEGFPCVTPMKRGFLQGEPTVPEIHTLPDLFQQYRYEKPYHQIFDDSVLISRNLAFTTTSLNAVFNKKQKPAYQILIISDGIKLKAVMLSIKDAAFFKEHLKRGGRRDMWLLLPDGQEISAHEHVVLEDSAQRKLVRAMWFVNFFNGNARYLDMREDLSRELMNERHANLLVRFLKLRVEYDHTQRSVFYRSSVLSGVDPHAAADGNVLCRERRREIAAQRKLLAGLTPEAIGALGEKDLRLVPYLNANQVPHLTHPTSIRKLTNEQIKSAVAAQVPHMTPAQIPAIPLKAELLNWVLPDKMAFLSRDQVQLLNEVNVKLLPAEKLPDLRPDQVKWVAIDQLPDLSDPQIADVGAHHVPHLPNERLRYLAQEAQVAALRLDQLGHLDRQFPLLSADQVREMAKNPALLPPAKVQLLKDDKLQYLALPEQIQAVALSRIRFLADAQLGSILDGQVPGVSDVQVPKLDNRYVQHLTDGQIAHVAVSQVAHVRIAQLGRLSTKDQIQSVAPQHVQRLQGRVQLIYISDAQVPFAAIEQIPHVNDEQLKQLNDVEKIQAVAFDRVKHLDDTQLPHLTPLQVPGATESQVPKLPNEQVKHLAAAQVQHVAVAQVSHVLEQHLPQLKTKDQIQAVADDLVQKLSEKAQLRHLSDGQVAHVLPAQVGDVNDAQLKLLPNDNLIQIVAVDRVRHLTDAQIPKILPMQVPGIKEARQIGLLDNMQLNGMTVDQIPLLDPTKLPHLTSPNLIQAVPDHLYTHLSDDQMKTKYAASSRIGLFFTGIFASILRIFAYGFLLYFLRNHFKVCNHICQALDDGATRISIARRLWSVH
ncbi:MAG: hypothetical protein HW387_1522 [Parachlamydiales bacterium]|nr:hypothetical protein [Parachlamydiales bacterium]